MWAGEVNDRVYDEVVIEKQQYMREVMTMTGLRRSAFWTINWLYSYFIFVCQLMICLMIGFGGGFRIFVSHDAAVPLLLYLIYGMALTSFGCFFSTFFNNRTVGGVIACCVVFLGGLYGWIIGETAVATSALDTSRVQAAALDCLARWEHPAINRYKPQLHGLISDKQFRETLTLFVIDQRLDNAMAAAHRPVLLPLLTTAVPASLTAIAIVSEGCSPRGN